MARHWSVFARGVTHRQALALDMMAQAHGLGNGMDLLMRLTGNSRSKIGKMDGLSLRPYINEAFKRYGRNSSRAAAADRPDPLTEAVEAGLARVNGEGSVTADARAQALAEIRRLMSEHGITVEDLA